MKGFTINRGDCIDSRQFTEKECERFCELAVENGHERGEWTRWYSDSHFTLFGVASRCSRKGLAWSTSYEAYKFTNNITTKFRDYLDKEKEMKQFTKDDLKDGMRLLLRDGDTYYVCGDHVISCSLEFADLDNYSEDLKDADCDEDYDIMRVTDRDGTVLFEREEPKEFTMQQVADKLGVPVEQLRIKE